jgi:hypothetical protein
MSATTVRPLFVFGLARSGTNLLARVLAAHQAVEIALDPFMPLFRTIRNATIAAEASVSLRAGFDPNSPFQDFYQTAQGYKLLDTLLASHLSAPIEPSELPPLRAAVAARAALEAPDIAAHADRLEGATCHDLVASALEIVESCRATAATRYVGIKEVWVLDFLPALARAFPAARFLAIERDPRAVIASLAALAERDPSQHAHPISYLRHWRKAAILARRFAAEPSLDGRFHLVRYEDLASRPGEAAGELADFLALPVEPLMLAPARDDESGGWQANSSYRDTAPGISDAPVARWRRHLPVATIRAVEFFCWPEMALADYPRTVEDPATASDDIAAYVARADADPGSWRSDSGDAASEMSFQALRHGLLDRPEPADIDLIRRCFLFRSAYRAAAAAIHAPDAPRNRAMS